MGEAAAAEGGTIVEEIIGALGDAVPPESEAWWQYLLVVKELGPDRAQQLVREVRAVEAAGGMTTRDGSRRRTPGGVFFVLAYEQLGPKRTKSLRSRATRRVHEAMLQRFLRLLALASPAAPERPVASAAPAKPARRQEPEEVEVLVVRRRPAAGGGAKPADPPKPPAPPRAGR